MSKKDNLTDFLKDVANTIRTNDGTSDTINPQDFSTKISNTVGSNIVKKSSSDLKYSNYTFTAPSGYYKDNATYSVTNTYSTTLYPSYGKSTQTLTFGSSSLYKDVNLTISTPSISEIIYSSFKGDIVATLQNDSSETWLTLEKDKLYLLQWEVEEPSHIRGTDVTISFSHNTSNCLSFEDIIGSDTSSLDDITTLYFLVYFDSNLQSIRVRYVDNDMINASSFLRVVGSPSYNSNYIDICVTGGCGGTSSETTLYVYKSTLLDYIP